MKSDNEIENIGNLSTLSKPLALHFNNASISIENSQIKQNINIVFERSFTNYKNKNNSESSKKILMLGLFELTSKYGVRNDGLSELLSAQMAVEHINDRKILPYILEIVWNDTKVLKLIKQILSLILIIINI